jgi:hypothetical protein
VGAPSSELPPNADDTALLTTLATAPAADDTAAASTEDVIDAYDDAAGAARGRAGEWHRLCHFLGNRKAALQLGPYWKRRRATSRL